jgi:molybdate transport system substrate-binding protein
VRIAAAADLTLAFEELGQSYGRTTGHEVTFSFGSTGLLAKQLLQGAPFDVFAAANVAFVDQVVAAGACDGTTRAPYARGRIAVWSRRGTTESPRHLAELAAERFARIAIANPEHAPYGQAARQALEAAGIWEMVSPRLVLAENVRQALQFAETGNADAAIVALSLVATRRDEQWFLVEEGAHRPIDQTLVVCERGGNRAGGLSFARYVASPEGRAVMRRHGFVLPGEAAPRVP